MNRLLEIGEIGLLRNIPEEIDLLTRQISALTRENNRLKSILRVGSISLAIYILYRLFKNSPDREQ